MNVELNQANQNYLDALPLRLLNLAVKSAKHPEITVKPITCLDDIPGYSFTFPPDHTNHDSTFHAPNTRTYEIHVRSAQVYVQEVEDELMFLIEEKEAYTKQIELGKATLANLSSEEIAALKLVLR